MPWPLPTPAQIAERLAAGYERDLGPLSPDGAVDARSPNTLLGVIGPVQAGAAWEQHLHLAWVARQLFVDTCDEDFLPVHAATWGVPRAAAAAASGTITLAGANGTVIPSGLDLIGPGDVTFSGTAGATISGGTASIPVVADVPGTAGNAPAGAVLRLVSPLAGLSAQQGTVAAPGLAGGLAEEAAADWRARILARIRDRSKGGAATDYEGWARAAGGLGAVRVIGNYAGLGRVGVVVALAGGLPAQPADLTRVAAAIAPFRPVTAVVQVVAATIVAQPLTIQIQPDTTDVRAAVNAALAAFYAREPGIGGTLNLSRLSEAISSAAGEYAHRIVAPTADVTYGETQLPVPGTITWQPWA